jgi:acetyltransferase-like isoleucine patch superfamily enzyme
MIPWKIQKNWARLWMRLSGLGPIGRVATWLAALFMPPYHSRRYLAGLCPAGYISVSAKIYGSEIKFGKNIYIDDYVVIYQGLEGGAVILEEKVQILRGTIMQTGSGGHISIGTGSCIQPNCQFSAHGGGGITIGSGVQIAPKCSFYPYDHSFEPDELIGRQPLKTKGGIVIGDDALLGVGVIVLDGVRIGKGAVIGAGSIVTKDIPAGAIAIGSPARVIKMRSALADESEDLSFHISGIEK